MSFESVDVRRQTTTTTDNSYCLSYKLPGAFGSGELKTNCQGAYEENDLSQKKTSKGKVPVLMPILVSLGRDRVGVALEQRMLYTLQIIH